MNVAILVYEGVYLLDFTGPMEVFTDAGLDRGESIFTVYTVSENTNPVAAHTGLRIIPAFSYEDAPIPDIVVVPGGNPAMIEENPGLARWLKDVIPKCRLVMSVCTGAEILASLGILDGLEVTSWHGALDRLQSLAPRAIVKEGMRFTDNGRVMTTAGISAGIDGALHAVSRLCSAETAVRTARYMEYEYREKE